MSGWGTPKYGNGGSAQTWSLEDGDNVYRILPPMLSFAEAGRWTNYVTVHYGYTGTDPKNPNGRKKPFRCIEVKDRRTGMVLEECPECTLFEERKQLLTDREAELRAQFKGEKKSEQEIEELLEAALLSLRTWVKDHRPDRKHYLNVLDREGTFGQLKISHRTKKSLEAKIDELRAEGVDPLALDQGVFFNIKRIGKGFTDPDVVEVVTRKVDVVVDGRKKSLTEVVLRPLTEQEAEKALRECRDLADVGGFVLTREQIRELTECSGDPEEVDKIFARVRREASPRPRSEANRPANSNAHPATPPANDNAGAIDASDPRVQVRLAELKAKREAEERAKTQMAAADNPLLMDDEAFLARFGGQA
jgi:hypothetical protein